MDFNLVELLEKFNSEDRCREYIEALRWPAGIRCARCGDRSVSRLIKRRQYQCNDCDYQFSATSGTVLHDSHLPLWKWFLATYLICQSKKGMSANQLHRILNVSYKTAWYLCHRIREAMKTDISEKLKGIVEAGETFVGDGHGRRRARDAKEKSSVVHMNSFENVWAQFKRGVVGSFHKVSEKHLDRYLDEFTYRFNGREDPDLFPRTLQKLVNGKPLTFETLTKSAF